MGPRGSEIRNAGTVRGQLAVKFIPWEPVLFQLFALYFQGGNPAADLRNFRVKFTGVLVGVRPIGFSCTGERIEPVAVRGHVPVSLFGVHSIHSRLTPFKFKVSHFKFSSYVA